MGSIWFSFPFGRLGYQILMDFYKIWHYGRMHQFLWHTFRFSIYLILDFIKVFAKISVFRNFGGQKLKISTIRETHFVERVILHLYWSFCAVCFKTLFFTNFLTLSRFWSKLAWSDPTKTSIYQKFSDRFRPNFVIRCQIDVG